MRTATRVQYDLIDTTARRDSTPSCPTIQTFADLTDLTMERQPPLPKYGTLEPRQWLMDGSFDFFPEQPESQYWGLWSSQISGPDGSFAAPPVLTVSFSQPHSSAGLTLHFHAPTGEWASEILIQWYGAGGQLLSAAQVRPKAADYSCDRTVQDYTRIRITFLATNIPGRYLKLSGIDYGVALTFAGDEIISAQVLEEIDMLSNGISVNTLDLTLLNREGRFSLLNPDSYFDTAQHWQKITVWETIETDARADPDEINMGTFYLSEWSNNSDTTAEMHAVDAVGLLDAAPFLGGIYDTTAGRLAAEILTGYNYELDVAYAPEPIKGYIPAGTRREALQQLAFALGAVVDCSRSDRIRIYPPPQRPSSLIPRSRKLQGGQASLKSLVTGAEVTAHSFRLEASLSEIFSGGLTAGDHRITFDQPAAGLIADGGELIEAGTTYAVVRLTAPGSVALSGHKYADEQTVISLTAGNLPPNAVPNILKVADATLVGPDRASDVAQRILDYYSNRYEITFRMLPGGGERLSDMLIVESFRNEKIRGYLEKLDLDLTGGCIASATVAGRHLSTTAVAYAGELYVGEEIGVL